MMVPYVTAPQEYLDVWRNEVLSLRRENAELKERIKHARLACAYRMDRSLLGAILGGDRDDLKYKPLDVDYPEFERRIRESAEMEIREQVRREMTQPETDERSLLERVDKLENRVYDLEIKGQEK